MTPQIKLKTPLVQEAYDIIKKKITYLELFPGQVISDYTLSKELDMSRTPIREALLELRRDGLLNDVDGGGYEVSRITKEDIIDLFDVREGLETTALKIAMRNPISIKDIDELKELNNKVLQANKEGKLKDVFYNDQQLHVKLVSLSKNKRIIGFNDTIFLQLIRMRFLTFFERNLPDLAYQEHDQLIQNISEGKLNRALEILSSHIQKTKASYIDILTNQISSEEFGALRFFILNEKMNL